MADQIIINFPEMTDEQYNAVLNIKDGIFVELWKSGERRKTPLEWDGTRICCPIKMWFDFPDKMIVVCKV